MPDKQATPTFYRGTAIKITVILDIATADTALITIDDPTETEKVSDASMTKDADKVYSYTWQSTTDELEGGYVVTIKVTSGSYTSVQQDKFTLIEQE